MERLALSAEQTRTMKYEIAYRIHHQKNGKTKQYHVSDQQKQAIVDQALAKLLAQVRAQFKPKVEQKVTAKITKTEHKINAATTRIRHHTKHEFSKAFIDIYKVANPVVFTLVLLAFIFKRNRQQSTDTKEAPVATK